MFHLGEQRTMYFYFLILFTLLKVYRIIGSPKKTGALDFNYRGENYVAKWDQIRKLRKLEYGNLIKMSKLTYVEPSPKPIERQKVDTCLKVFCNETVDTLKFHPHMQDENFDGTVTLITIKIEFWRIVNVKSSFKGLRLNDSLRDAISSFTYLRL